MYIVPRNGGYTILKEFAVSEKTPNVLGRDFPGLDVVPIVKGFGYAAIAAHTREGIQVAFSTALSTNCPRPL
jgi:benzoylformate decarboxylase